MTKSVKTSDCLLLLVIISVLYGCVAPEKTVKMDGYKSLSAKNTADGGVFSSEVAPECVKYNAGKVEEFLKNGGNPNMKVVRFNADLLPLLHIAVLCNDRSSAKLLLDNGASVNEADNNGDIPLHIARSVSVAELLLTRGADVKAKNKKSVTPFGSAVVRLGDPEILGLIKLLFDNGADANERGGGGRLVLTPVIMSFGGDDLIGKILSLAIGSGLDLNQNDGELLGVAVDLHKWELAELLIDNGARVDLFGGMGDSPFGAPSIFERIVFVGNLKLVEKTVRTLKTGDVRSVILDRAMFAAAGKGNVEMLKLMIAAGGDINGATNSEGISLIGMAVMMRQMRMVKFLVENGVDLRNSGASLVGLALEAGDKEILKYLLAQGASLYRTGEDGKEFSGWPLYPALSKKDIAMAKLLLEFGVDVNGNINGEPLLLILTRVGNVVGVRVLLKHGADKNVAFGMFPGMPPSTPLSVAQSADNKELTALLSGESDFEFILASMKGDVAKVNSLVEKGFNPNFVDDEGDMPLFIAVSNGNIALVEALLSGGANPNIKEPSSGKTPLHIAALKGNLNLMGRLVDADADINAHDNHGRTPLHYAIGINDDAKTKFFLEHGASLNAKDYEGISVLSLAASKGNKSIFTMLFKAGAAIDAVNNDGMTVLHEAIKRKDGDFVALLLEKGANTNVRDNSGKTALHVAVLNGEEAMVRKLLSTSGTTVDIQDNDGKTSLHYAVAANNSNMVFNLVKSGASPSIKDNAGATPMDIARAGAHIDKSVEKIINILKRGANVVSQ